MSSLSPATDILVTLQGSAAQTVYFPDSRKLPIGSRITIVDWSTQTCTISDGFITWDIYAGEVEVFILRVPEPMYMIQEL